MLLLTAPKSQKGNFMLSKYLSILLLVTGINSTAFADKFEERNFIEDLAAVMASKAMCGYQTNKRMVSLSFQAVNMSPSDLLPGGKLRKELLRNISHIELETQKEKGRKVFCNSVLTKLSVLITHN